ncbi:2,3-bisphosphoglycerate-dependent phosphoglycerate mutase [Actinocrinis sp.]|uniref:2,3-bisphosphoglycerate-dependent phosphoglycerate mutase n=1 Tax=Actinocrinis sp. TaxID=1920516 RepID=UPI002D753205|nr:2,3-bisphosphoglycerate-dependent phosphoglycerate mutase [Actinocrinis sp.]HZP51338.1 2,3-bisphosphoglycerate-dependent phosphoglycerate mutase [Actinocrinis sp.]
MDPVGSASAEFHGCRLILLRHGQSEFNAANRFTGWADPPLTGFGEHEAAQAGQAIAAAGCRPDVAFTSLLQRAVATTRLVLTAADRPWVPVHRSWQLNGRHYGALQGKDKNLIREEFGAERVQRWRRSYDERPPALPEDPNLADPRYAALPPRVLPHTESLRDVTARLLPYWSDAIAPQLRAGRVVLIVAHGNTLRALIKWLDGISDAEITRLEVPTARPLLYLLDAAGKPLVPGGVFLVGAPSRGK